MNITLVNTLDSQGGAAKAAGRLHLALRAQGTDSHILVRHCLGGVPFTTAVGLDKDKDNVYPETVYGLCIQRHIIDENRTPGSNGYFSFSYPGLDIAPLSILQRTHCINLHWVERFLSPESLRRLFRLGKPVVWTLHDQAPFTGGCHYTMGCNAYKTGCSGCPQLAENPWDMTAAVLADKEQTYRGANLTIVTPSRWMATQAKQSRLLGGFRIETIPNSLDIDVFKPLPRQEARQALGLPVDADYLLLGSYDLKEARKGSRPFMEAMAYVLQNPVLEARVSQGRIRLLTFGHPDPELQRIGMPVHTLGYLESEEALARAYASADIFVLPSLEDNLPNTILEAMSCGTAVAAFDAGGIPEMVKEGVTGRLARTGDAEDLARIIVQLVNEDDRQFMGLASRKRVEREYAPRVQAGEYLGLLNELVRDVVDGGGGVKVKPGAERLQEPNDVENVIAAVVSTSGLRIGSIYEDLVVRALKRASLRLPGLEENERILADRNLTIDKLQRYIEDQQRYTHELHSYVEDLRQVIDQREKNIRDLQAVIEQRESHISDLNQVVDQYKLHVESIHEDGLRWLLSTATRPQRPYSFLHESVEGMTSVVLAVVDDHAGLERSIRSVWSQTVPPSSMELLVCDDGSSGGRRDLLMNLSNESPLPLQHIVHSGRSKPCVTAMQDMGVSHARGEFVAFLQPGDAWRSERLSLQLQVLKEHWEIQCVCGGVEERTAEGRRVRTRRGLYGLDQEEEYAFTPPYTFQQFLHGNPVTDSTLLIRRRALAEAGASPEHLAYPTGVWLQLAKISLEGPICYLDATVVDAIVPEESDGQPFPPERAYGEDLEFLSHLLHWMLQHPRHREHGVQIYWEHYPRLMQLRGDAYRLLEAFYRHYGHNGELWEFKEYFNNLAAELVLLRKKMKWVEGVKTAARCIPGLTWTSRHVSSLAAVLRGKGRG